METVEPIEIPKEINPIEINKRIAKTQKIDPIIISKTVELFEKHGEYLFNNGRGIVEVLKMFKAYEDPVGKKAFLLIKFLHRRGLIKVKDLYRFEIPVDNHLTRIALRLGIVKPDQDILDLIEKDVEVSSDVDYEIRLSVRTAWKIVSKLSGIDLMLLDDFLWTYGRTVCKYGLPDCNYCIFKNTCTSYLNNRFINEHRYTLTWYY